MPNRKSQIRVLECFINSEKCTRMKLKMRKRFQTSKDFFSLGACIIKHFAVVTVTLSFFICLSVYHCHWILHLSNIFRQGWCLNQPKFYPSKVAFAQTFIIALRCNSFSYFSIFFTNHSFWLALMTLLRHICLCKQRLICRVSQVWQNLAI